MDLNGDDQVDFLTGSFCGVPRWIPGNEDGFGTPAAIRDKDGDLVLINKFWNFETEEWDKVDSDGPKGLGTSVAAVDWDNDGDLDLVLGSYSSGNLYLRINEGTATKPAFATANSFVKAGGKPAVIEGGISTPRIADWNGDGLFDIVVGGITGGVFLFENSGSAEAPRFDAMTTLIKPLPGDSHAKKSKWVPATEDFQPTAPGSSFHIEIVDYDSDGDLDILTGARCEWQASPKKVKTAETEKLAQQLKEKAADLMVEMKELTKDAESRQEKDEIRDSKKYQALLAKYNQSWDERSELLDDGSEEGDFTWLFRRKQ